MTAEHIAERLPTDLKWAVAGRSEEKLKRVVSECQKLNPNRIQPGKAVLPLSSPVALLVLTKFSQKSNYAI